MKALILLLLCGGQYHWPEQSSPYKWPQTATQAASYSWPIDKPQQRRQRLLLFGAKWCSGCRWTKNELKNPDVLNPLFTVGLTADKHIQLIDVDEHPDLQKKYGITNLPTWVLLEDEKEIARIKPSDNFKAKDFAKQGALLYNSDHKWKKSPNVVRRPTPRGVDWGYPVRGNLWSGCGNWQHLTVGPHAGKFDRAWLQSLTWMELQSLHSDDHEGRVQWQYVVR